MTLTTDTRHQPIDDCDGTPVRTVRTLDGAVLAHAWTCDSCNARLCACEVAYGHDCEGEA